MTPTATLQQPSLSTVKQRQQAAWESGNYAAVAARVTVLPGELLCEAADLQAGSRVLDVATGTGNTALSAARRGWESVGVDYVEDFLEHGRRRAKVEGLPVQFVHGDAEALPFPDASFDAVLSVFGAMFAPDQERTAAELLRVCRRGGTIGLVSWTPDSLLARSFAAMSQYAPPPAGLSSPFRWGSRDGAGELLGDRIDWIRFQTRTSTFRFASPEEYVRFFRTNYGPMVKTFERLDAEDGEALAEELASLAVEHGRLGARGAITVEGEYAEVVAGRSTR